MPGKRDYFRELTGEKREKVFKRTPWRQSMDLIFKQGNSTRPLRILGEGASGSFALTEEEMYYHTHVIGTTQQGKSYFLQHLMREDINKGIGFCYLDPTGLGKNAKAVLRYCASKGLTKVCVIDYMDHFRKGHAGVVAGINPFLKKAYKSASVTKAVDSMMVLYNVKDQADVGRIGYYLPAVFSVIAEADGTMYDSVYFMERNNPLYKLKRGEILEQSGVFDTHRITLEAVFGSKNLDDWREFRTTSRRFGTIVNQDTLKLMFGATKGIDFMKMVSDGWVILVNLSPTQAFNLMSTRFLGVSIINEILFAIERLYKNDWRGRYNLYIDEVSRFANTKLVDTLSNMLQFGLRVTMAHQSFAQITDPYIREQIPTLCDFKVMFHTPGRSDRDRMIKDMYGGDITDREASYANMNLPKQEAIIKAPKGSPERIRIADVAEVDISKDELEDYKTSLYKASGWYHDPKELWEEIKKRYGPTVSTQPREATKDTRPPTKRTKADKQTDSHSRISSEGSTLPPIDDEPV